MDRLQTMTPATLRYVERLVDTFSFAEASAVLKALGKYQLAEVWYVRKDYDTIYRGCRASEGAYWESQTFNKVPLKSGQPLKQVPLQIRFYGGPPKNQGYRKGTLRTYVCDRLLGSMALMGKAYTSKRIFRALAQVRKLQCAS